MKKGLKFFIGIALIAIGALCLPGLFGDTADKASLVTAAILFISGGTSLLYFNSHPRKFKKRQIAAIIVVIFVLIGLVDRICTGIFGESRHIGEGASLSVGGTFVDGNSTDASPAVSTDERTSGISSDCNTDDRADTGATTGGDTYTDTDSPAQTDAKSPESTNTVINADTTSPVTPPADAKPPAAATDTQELPKTQIPAKPDKPADSSAPKPIPQESSAVTPEAPSTQAPSPSVNPVRPTEPDIPITIVNIPQSVHRNEIVTLTIKAKPNTAYRLRVRYKSGWSEANGLGTQTSDAAGNVSWTWKVGGRTTLGTWPMEISDGETVNLEFTVVS